MAYTAEKMMIPAAALMLLQFCFVAQATGAAAASCLGRCGSMIVPYPFGIGDSSCYLTGFNLTCDRTSGRERLLIGGAGATLEVVQISLANSTVRVIDTAGAVTITNHATALPVDPRGAWSSLGAGAVQGPFVVSPTRNRFVVTGCNVQGTLLGEGTNLIAGCSAFCAITDNFVGATSKEDIAACAGAGCCETPITIGRPSYVVRLMPLDMNQEMDQVVPMEVRVAETGWFQGASAVLLNQALAESSRRTAIPVVLEWAMCGNQSKG